MLNIVNNHNYSLNEVRGSFHRIFNLTILKVIGKNAKEISASLLISDCDEIRFLNKKYRQNDKSTDVLSFKCNAEFVNSYLGDIVVCYPIAEKQSIEYQHSLKRELCFLFLHGLLHLLGYDHDNESNENLMFSLQKSILVKLNIKR